MDEAPKPTRHDPVLATEVLEFLEPGPGRVFLDATLGGGGHAERILDAGASLVALDRDREALDRASERLARFGDRFRPLHANFAAAGPILDTLDAVPIDGALLDLGVSSHQLDNPERGFSFRFDGPLDMRMDPSAGITAADLVNSADPDELARIFREFGEEPRARQLAHRIARERARRPFTTTLELAHCIESSIPRHGRTHPATRAFQALRIAVNRELEAIPDALDQIVERLRPGARIAVISFHSLEDRIVKRFFRERGTPLLDRPEWPAPRPNPAFSLKILTPHPISPSPEETARNPRARSARLRAAQRIQP